jgi:hypothetical protein
MPLGNLPAKADRRHDLRILAKAKKPSFNLRTETNAK